MSFSETAESPVVVGGVTFPKLSLRSSGVVASQYKAEIIAGVKSVVSSEKASADAKVRWLIQNTTTAYGLDDLWAWAYSAEGANAVLLQSLIQGGKGKDEAQKIIDSLPAIEARNAALEVCDSPNAPSKIKAREEAEKAEGKKNTDPPQSGE